MALKMVNTGDVIIPKLAGMPFVGKPPLYFAASAIMVI
jgi:4-amino-4-deoxy-L-arabinose transferase-like glycosyltransferase